MEMLLCTTASKLFPFINNTFTAPPVLYSAQWINTKHLSAYCEWLLNSGKTAQQHFDSLRHNSHWKTTSKHFFNITAFNLENNLSSSTFNVFQKFFWEFFFPFQLTMTFIWHTLLRQMPFLMQPTPIFTRFGTGTQSALGHFNIWPGGVRPWTLILGTTDTLLPRNLFENKGCKCLQMCPLYLNQYLHTN